VAVPRFRYRLPVVVGIEGLTAHEREIVDLKCGGELTNQEIGVHFGRAENTIKAIITGILRKTGRLSMVGVCYDYGAAVARQLPWDSFRADQI